MPEARAPARLRKDIAWVIIIKIMALFLLWFFLFRHPLTSQLDVHALAQHYLS